MPRSRDGGYERQSVLWIEENEPSLHQAFLAAMEDTMTQEQKDQIFNWVEATVMRGPKPRPPLRNRGRLLPLTAKDEKMLQMLANGWTGVEIARIWRISEESIKTRKRNIFRKLEARTTTHAVARWLRMNPGIS